MASGSTSDTTSVHSRYPRAFAVSFALHLLVVLAVVGLPGPRPALAPVPVVTPSRSVEVFTVAPAEDARFPGLHPLETAQDDWTIKPGDTAAALQIDGFDVDVSKISDRARVLFPFLTPGLSLEVFGLLPRRDVRSRLENPLATRSRQPGGNAPALVLGEARMQKLIDKSWSRHERWKAFEPLSKIAQAHTPDAGDLPALLRMHCDQNALQPFRDTRIRDQRLWAQLGLAADHVTFIAFIRQYASEHPSTKATTELLFLLDKLAEANRDALGVMLDNPPERSLGWTRAGSVKAYQLIVRIRWYYEQELNRRGLMSETSIDAFYDTTRLAILEGIVRTTPNGYRADDARFLIGAIYWRQGKLPEALRRWREMALDGQETHRPGAAEITLALRSGKPDFALVREIDRILRTEQRRWVDFSLERLARFGYRFDTF
jgi:hypothetical protein